MKYKIAYRYTEKIHGYSLAVRISYNCPKSKRRWYANGYSNIFGANPFQHKDLYEQAHFQAIASAKKKAVCKYNMVMNVRVVYEYLIIWRVQEPAEVPLITPDVSYKKAEARYGKNFIPKADYHFLKKYYNYDLEKLTENQQNRRIKLLLKYRKVIDSWPTKETRKARKKLREEVGED